MHPRLTPSLALGNKAKSDTGTGKIVQLMAMDAEQIANSLHMLQQLLEVPILITACLMFVYSLVGPSALVALIVILVAGPANYRGTNLFLKVDPSYLETIFMVSILYSIH